jgi:hypothetical protein
MNNIDIHIKANIDELNDGLLSRQRRRHLEDELQQLLKYKINHPNDDHDPSSLELYCDENPECKECRVYEN